MKDNLSLIDVLRSLGAPRLKTLKLVDYILGGVIIRCLPTRARKAVSQQEVRKLLIIRPGGIGDAIFLWPILKKINEERPNINIDVLCEKRNHEAFTMLGGQLNKIYEYTKLTDLKAVTQNRYDAVVDTEQWHFLSAILASRIQSPILIGFASRSHRGKLFTHSMAYGINDYELENFRRLFEPIFPFLTSIKDINSCYTLSESKLAWARNMIPEKNICLFLGGSIASKRLNLDQNKSIIDSLLKDNLKVIFMGGRDSSGFGAKLWETFNNDHIVDLTGKISLEESAAIIKESTLFIGTDSGLTHLANAVGTPVIAIFGVSDPQKWGPKGKKTRIIKSINSPCSIFSYTIPRDKNDLECLDRIDVNQIMKEIRYLINESH